VNVDVVPIYVGERARFWLAICAITVSLAFCLLMTVLTFQFWYEAYENGWVSDTMWRARLWIPYGAMPVGLGILTLQYVADLLNLLTGREPPFGIEVKERSVDVSLPESGTTVNIPGAGI
jgi:TRAP-type C4-dicarboxylate transport system permease small subunit